MHHQVGISTDRGGEVQIISFGQTVVSIGGVPVACLLQAAQEFNSQNLTNRVLVNQNQRLGNLLFGSEFSTGNAKELQELTEFFQVFLIRVWMNPKNSG